MEQIGRELGAMHFTEEELEHETRAGWYLRQVLGAANFEGGPTLHILSGNLGFQIEHHLFPDLPSNRYAESGERVRALCDKYDIPYTTGPLHRKYGQALRTIVKLSPPNHMTNSTGEDGQVTAATLDKRGVTQCALSRGCGVCGASSSSARGRRTRTSGQCSRRTRSLGAPRRLTRQRESLSDTAGA